MSLSVCRNNRQQQVDAAIRRYAAFVPTRREIFWYLMNAVRSRSAIFAPSPQRGRYKSAEIDRLLLACVRLVCRSEQWIRSPCEWVAPNASVLVQFCSLVRHLLDEYPVPSFMPRMWLQPDARWEIELHLHLAKGRSLRQFETQYPQYGNLRITKRIARHFMTAPADLSAATALRWAQVCAMGGDQKLARLVTQTEPLSALTTHEVFWEHVIAFLIREQPICDDETQAIVSFVHRQRFLSADEVWGVGAGERPLQPDLTLQGRTLMSLRRHMANWRTELVGRLPDLVPALQGWQGTDIQPLQFRSGSQTWTIEELRTDKELYVEGGIMKHCVDLYIPECAGGQTSIWSMRVRDDVRVRRVMTIEVHPCRRLILQARGKKNAVPEGTPLTILERWAAQEQLAFSYEA